MSWLVGERCEVGDETLVLATGRIGQVARPPGFDPGEHPEPWRSSADEDGELSESLGKLSWCVCQDGESQQINGRCRTGGPLNEGALCGLQPPHIRTADQ